LAIEDALKKTPEAKGLKNVKVNLYVETGYTLFAILAPGLFLIGLPINQICYEVEGIPAK
jgi:hypothetical protein